MTNNNSQTKKRNPVFYLIMGFLALLALLILYIFFASRRELPTIPNVSILGEISGSQVSVGQAVIVQAIANDPEGIVKAEFWVNDVLIGTQLNPNPDVEGGFAVSEVWRPTDAGPYSVYVRAEDTKGYLGQSELVVIVAISDESVIPADASSQVFADDGDTLASMAEDHGSTEEELTALNPGLGGGAVPGGASVLVPQPHSEDGGEEDDDVSQVGRPAGGGGGIGQAALGSNPPRWIGAINLSWVNSICLAMPNLCGGIQNLGENPPSAPTDIIAEAIGACQVSVSWTDNAENETGYNLYRFPSLGDGFIGEFKPGEGSGGRFNYIDTVNAGARWYYVVSAVNQAGEASSAPSDLVDVECSLDVLPGNALAVEIEVLSMTLSGSTPDDGKLYCYVSLMGNAHERIPTSPIQFFTQQDLEVDIATYLGGENSRVLVVQQEDLVTINAECLALTGEGPVSLGSFSGSHPSPEWDGRTLSASSDSGQYDVTYRINGDSDPMQFFSAHFELVDASIPPPINLDIRYLGAQRLCRSTNAGVDCQVLDEGEVLFWEVATDAEWPMHYEPQDIWGFKIYTQRPGWTEPKLYKTISPIDNVVTGGSQHSDKLNLCIDRGTYYVSAMVLTASGILDSPLSEGFDFVQDCAVILEITMDRVVSGELDDGLFDDIVEAFGDFYIGTGANGASNFVLRWNTHPAFFNVGDFNLTVSYTPYTTSVGSNNTRRGESMYLSVLTITGGQVGLWIPNDEQLQNNNTVYVVMLPGDDLVLWGYLYDHDGGGLRSHKYADDEWCSFTHILLSRTGEDWLTFNRTIETAGSGEDGSCTVTWRVRGVARDEMPGS